ncbi:MAG: molybdopterin molybdotransferase MoeA [Nocardioides sp.]|nr:molybdopterin molybdotransferase MoeA [Nocardioides sp.]
MSADNFAAVSLGTVDDHLERILSQIDPLTPYEQQLLDAMGQPVCEDITAPMPLPAFDNSGMDGYAVCFADVVTASRDHPVHLPVVGEIAAGQTTIFAMSPGTTVRIMTGAPVPYGADAVVPVEWTDGSDVHVRIHRAPTEGQHIRRQGEDVQPGDVLLEDGTILGPRQLGLLASVGRSQVRSRPRPRLVIISTGSELRDPGTPLAADSVYDANSYMLAASARAAGAITYRVGIVSDDPEVFADALSDQLVRADMVVTSGGVSKGQYDVVKDVLGRTGTVEFGEVAMQPGKPQGFGFIGEDRTPIFTLPGNPVSAYVSFEVFCIPAIRQMMGRLPYSRPQVRALTSHRISSPEGKRQYVRAQFEVDRGGAHVTPIPGHGSHLVGDLSDANALIVVPEDVTSVAPGTHVQVLVLDRDF